MIREGLKNVSAGANPIDVKKGIEIATEKVVDYLKSKSVEVKGKEKIVQVATVSANNDEEIGNLIADAMPGTNFFLCFLRSYPFSISGFSGFGRFIYFFSVLILFFPIEYLNLESIRSFRYNINSVTCFYFSSSHNN